MILNHAVVFPGQGSQSLGMLSDLATYHPTVLKTFSSVSGMVGYDVWDLVQQGPLDKLNQTVFTQVAMLTADVAVYRVLKEQGMSTPNIMSGHSLGEYAALVCAGAIELEDAAKLVASRGQIMQETVPQGIGAMAAIVGLSDEDVQVICDKASSHLEQVTPANYNAIGQVVIAGHVDAVHRAMTFAEENNARLAVIIPVSVPCHCPLLKKAAEAFAEVLQSTSFKTPEIPVISNADLSTYKSTDQIRTLLSQQLYEPVRWVETIQMMKRHGIQLIIESGPGKVLSGLIKRIDKSLQLVSVNDEASLQVAHQLF